MLVVEFYTLWYEGEVTSADGMILVTCEDAARFRGISRVGGHLVPRDIGWCGRHRGRGGPQTVVGARVMPAIM